MKRFLFILAATAALFSGCTEKGPFDADGYKILSFRDAAFKTRMVEQHDANGDGQVSIFEASRGVASLYNGQMVFLVDCDNTSGSLPRIVNAPELRYFLDARVILFQNNQLSGELDLRKLNALRTINFTGNAGLTLIRLNSTLEGTVSAAADPGTEIRFEEY